MGPPGLRHWLWLAYMRHNNITGDDDLPRRAYLRGLFMEELAKNSALEVDADSGNVFLMGVLSMMEEIIGESPTYLLRGFPLQLLDRYRNAYDLLLKYAKGYEDGTPLPDIRLSLDRQQVERKYRLCEENADAAIWRMDTPI